MRLALLNAALASEGKKLSNYVANPLEWRVAVMRGDSLIKEEDSNSYTQATPVPQQHDNHVLVLTVPEEMLRWRK